MKKTKLLALGLALSTLITVVAGCGNNSKKGTDTQTSKNTEGAQKTHHLKILGTEGWAPCNNWNEVKEYSAWKILQSKLDRAGLKIDWEVVTAEQYSVVLQTRLASGNDLPDIAKAHTLDNAAVLSLAKQGIILPINDMIEKYSNGNIKKAFNETFPAVKALNTAEDGKMYWFSNVQNKYLGDNKNADGSFTIMYRKDWADKLGIKEPTNLSEFTDMLKAFRSKDANDSGKADEILFIDLSTFRTAIAQWFDLGTSFIALDPQNNKIVTPWKNKNVKAYFKYLNSLVNEDIIDPSVAGNYELMGQKMAENKIAGLWDYANANWNEPRVASAAPDALYAPLMPLPAVDGVKPASMSEPGSLVWEKFIVTKACKDPEAVVKLMDIVYTDEYGILTAFGEEGKNFKYVDGVITPIEGLTADAAKEKRISEGAMLWNGVLPRVQSVDMRQQVAGKDQYKAKVTLDLVNYDKKYPDQINNFLAMPTESETARINDLQVNIETASKELSTKLALGKISIDNLEKEVEKLDKLGLSELIEITQARYDRYLARLPKK